MRRQLFKKKIYFFLLSFITISGCSKKLNPGKLLHNNTFAYSWSPVNSSLNNIITPLELSLRDTINIGKKIKEINKLPKGHRVIRLWDSYQLLTRNQKDKKRVNVKGKDVLMPSIWWDKGLIICRKFHEKVFRIFKENEVELDMVILDAEDNFSNWVLDSYNKHSLKENKVDIYDIQMKDERYSKLKKKLSFSNIDVVKQRSHTKKPYLEWNALMNERKIEYLNKAIYEPIKSYYPDIKFSNYGAYYYNKETGVPEVNGHKEYLYGTGGHVGTHQCREFYGRLGQIATTNKPDNAQQFNPTPYNAFIYEVYKFHSMKEASSVPIHAWLSNKSFKEPTTYLHQSDYYQEMIYHLLCKGVDQLLYWNAHRNAKDDVLLSKIMKHYDQIALLDTSKTRVGSDVKFECNWNANYIISRMNANPKVYRFTPRINEDVSLENIITNRSPATFLINGVKIELVEFKILDKSSLSSKGVWLEKY